MAGKGFTISKEEALQYAADSAQLGAHVEALLKQPGWKIFVGLYTAKKIDILQKDDYEKLEDFKADRGSIRIVEELFNELREALTDADEAVQTLEKLNKAENQTPQSMRFGDEADQEQG